MKRINEPQRTVANSSVSIGKKRVHKCNKLTDIHEQRPQYKFSSVEYKEEAPIGEEEVGVVVEMIFDISENVNSESPD